MRSVVVHVITQQKGASNLKFKETRNGPIGAKQKLERKDYFKSVATLEDLHVNVSASELALGQRSFKEVCLLQVGNPGQYSCAYLNDGQVRELVDVLNAYLVAVPEAA